MLEAALVIPFLHSENAEHRYRAFKYFEFAHDVTPLTAEDVWRAFIATGLEERAPNVLELLKAVPPHPFTVPRLVEFLETAPRDSVRERVDRSLFDIDYSLLEQHKDQLLAAQSIDYKTRAHLAARLEMAHRPMESLWSDLLEFCRKNDLTYWNKLDHKVPNRLVEALARHGEAAAELAMGILNDDSITDYRRVFAIDLAVATRHLPALPILLDKLIDEEGDVSSEQVMYGVPRLAGVDAVAEIVVRYPKAHESSKNYMAEAMGAIKHRAAETALIELFRTTDEITARGFLAASLIDLFTTEGLGPIVDFALDEYDEWFFDLMGDVVDIAEMTAQPLPRRAEIEAQLAYEEQQREANRAARDGRTGPLLRAIAGGGESLRSAPKIGRNDPCPCGSGKKYKKCCLRN